MFGLALVPANCQQARHRKRYSHARRPKKGAAGGGDFLYVYVAMGEKEKLKEHVLLFFLLPVELFRVSRIFDPPSYVWLFGIFRGFDKLKCDGFHPGLLCFMSFWLEKMVSNIGFLVIL